MSHMGQTCFGGDRRSAWFTERFWASVERTDGCWEWRGGRNAKGYGVTWKNRRHVLVHRVSWEVHNGHIPDGLFVLHHCDNPPCVNPAHLFLGTNADNMRDMAAKGRGNRANPKPMARGERVGSARLCAADVREIRVRRAAGATYQELAGPLGVSVGAIGQIVSGKTWRHVD